MHRFDNPYLMPTDIIDSDHPRVRQYAREILGTRPLNPIQKATRLYYAVRDDIGYNPYSPFYRPEHFQASKVISRKKGFCISKASLLCALGRLCGIPTRVGFATVRNHIATKQLIELLGSNIFVYHGYTEFLLENGWIKATPAFDRHTCKRHCIAPLEFDGRKDSIFHAYNNEKQLFMEYLEYHGSHITIPVKKIVAAFKKAYGEDRVLSWIDQLEKLEDWQKRKFGEEEVLLSNF